MGTFLLPKSKRGFFGTLARRIMRDLSGIYISILHCLKDAVVLAMKKYGNVILIFLINKDAKLIN